MQSSAKTVKEYIASLPPDRKGAIEAVRRVVLANLDTTYEEGMQYGMIGWYVPHAVFPPGYHCDPKVALPFAGLASQKNYMSLYLAGVYWGPGEGGPMKFSADAKWFRDAWAKTGKKLDMGKCCIRFKKLDDLPLDVVGEAIRRIPAKKHVEMYVKALEWMGKGPDGKPLKTGASGAKAGAKAGAKKPAAKRASAKRTGANAAVKKKVVKKTSARRR